MKRTVLIAATAILLLGVAYVLGYFNELGAWLPGGSSIEVHKQRFDADGDGTVDLKRWRIGSGETPLAALWRWDRDGDGNPEVIAFDSVADADDGLTATGAVTAWDIGNDGVLDEGTVPAQLQELLRSEEVNEASVAAGEGDLELVDMQTRSFVDEIHERYDAWRLSGFRLPIVGAKLPDADRLLPEAQRVYRHGIHQGFDMYPGHVGVPTGWNGPVTASKDGTVIRADTHFTELTLTQYNELIALSKEAGMTPADAPERLRGRQVWIDHGHGIVTRYCHLERVADGIVEGASVEAGDVVATVGNSGTIDGVRGSEAGAHLHFELRIDDSYLGHGLTAEQIRAAGRTIFGLSE